MLLGEALDREPRPGFESLGDVFGIEGIVAIGVPMKQIAQAQWLLLGEFDRLGAVSDAPIQPSSRMCQWAGKFGFVGWSKSVMPFQMDSLSSARFDFMGPL
ncbi:MAG: hypothetical protein ACI8T1_002829 [Verrucomicrobiales bacterium]